MKKSDKFTIIIDTREQHPWDFLTENADAQILRSKLPAGDYSVQGFENCVAIERKSIQDLAQTISMVWKADEMQDTKEGRFRKEIRALRDYRYKSIVVEGSMEQIMQNMFPGNIKPKSILMGVQAVELIYGVHFVWCSTRQIACYWSFNWLRRVNELLRSR